MVNTSIRFRNLCIVVFSYFKTCGVFILNTGLLLTIIEFLILQKFLLFCLSLVDKVITNITVFA